MIGRQEYEPILSIPLNKIQPFSPFKEFTPIRNESNNVKVSNNNWSLVTKPAIFMLGYFLANLILTLHTKWLLSNTKFTFPWILSGLHIFLSGLGAWITLKLGSNGQHKFMKMSKPFLIKIALFSTLYSINIAMSNVSMKYISLSLHQITRSGTPLITLLLEFLILGRRANFWCLASLIPVMAGIVLSVLGEMKGFEFTTYGLFLTILGVVLSSLKGVMTNFLLVGGFKMNPLELIALVGPLAALQCVFLSAMSGELSTIYKQYSSIPFNWLLLIGLLANGCLAFFLNWISFAVNKETSALALTVAGNVKQAVSIGLAIIIFNTPLTFMNGIGIVVTLLGGAWYSAISLKQKQRKKLSSSQMLINVRFCGFVEDSVIFFKKNSIYRIESDFEDGICFTVERQLNEFQKLWELLEAIYPSQLIPPLPEKSILEKDSGKDILLKLALQVTLNHPILREDEYFKAFLSVEKFAEYIPLIKNVDEPVQVKKEYFKKWPFTMKKMSKDFQYRNLTEKLEDLQKLKDKLRQLIPLFDRLNYEYGEVAKAAGDSEKAIRNLLYLNKSKRLYADDTDKTGEFLIQVGSKNVNANENGEKEDIIYFLTFCVKYIQSTEGLLDRLDRFRNYLANKREKVSDLGIKLDRMQMPLQSKPSFDLIYQTKMRHERLLEEIAVVEVTYEKFSDLVLKELEWILEWIKTNFNSKLLIYYH